MKDEVRTTKDELSLDESLQWLARIATTDDIVWRPTCVPWIRYYYAESSLYLLRDMRHTHPSYALVYGKSPDAAAKYQKVHGGWGKVPASLRRSRERYQEWLRADSSLSFREWMRCPR